MSRVILPAGAAIGALRVAVAAWFAVSDRSVDQSPEAVTRLNNRRATVRAAAAVLRAPEPRTGLRVNVARGLADVRPLEAAVAEVLGSTILMTRPRHASQRSGWGRTAGFVKGSR